MQVDGESLQMGDAPRTRFALSPSLLDAAHYPSLRFTGNCNSARTVGALNLHGVTRPLILVEKRRGNRIIATGTLHRQDYGIRGAPGWIGGSIAITFSVDLPASIAAQLPATN
jgi:polyisoprenoid-binding protein YceI